MRIVCFLGLLFLCLFNACTTTFRIVDTAIPRSTIIKKGKIESVIFAAEAECFLCNLGERRFSPTLLDVEKAEKILKSKLKATNYPIFNQGDGCPIIHKNLKNYRRQYYGYIDQSGNKILFVNFSWAKFSIWDRLKGYYKDESEDWKTSLTMVLDGCSYYWTIHINLDQESLSNLGINGPA